MNWIRRFMLGRYGSDQLSWGILALYVLVSLFLNKTWIGLILTLALLIIFWYRILSHDIYKRRAENQLFLSKMYPVINWFKSTFSQIKDRDHRYYRCPRCSQKLRVPKNRGKIAITCPRCGSVITKNT